MTRKTGVLGFAAMLGTLALGVAWTSEASAQEIQCNNGVAPAKEDVTGAVLMLLDRSGSMVGSTVCNGSTPDPDDPRKWKCAVDRANAWVSLEDSEAERVYFVWQFRRNADANYTEQFNGADLVGMCQADALALLQVEGEFEGPVVDDAATPLAGSYCDAVDFLEAYRSGSFMENDSLPLYINLQTDGLENRTPEDHICFGPDSGAPPPPFDPAPPANAVVFTPDGGPFERVDGLLLGSWQAQMYDSMITGAAHEFPYTDPGTVDPAAYVRPGGFNPTTVINVVNFIEDFIPTTSARTLAMSAAPLAVGVDQATRISAGISAPLTASSALAVTTSSGTEDYVNFLNGLALSSGGRMTRMGSGATIDPDSPYGFHLQEGDVDDSGCVDQADWDAMADVYSLPVSADNIATIRADLAPSGWVDIADFFVLAANWGAGCATPPPGEAPVIGGALLGFEDPAAWSSTAPLSLRGARATEGRFAIEVGGTSWREIVSEPFNSFDFPSATDTLAVDVMLPTSVSNPWWVGQVLIFVSAPSKWVYDQLIGAVELTGRPLGEFSTAEFVVPWYLRHVFEDETSDVTLRIAVNADDPGYRVDNLRFVP